MEYTEAAQRKNEGGQLSRRALYKRDLARNKKQLKQTTKTHQELNRHVQKYQEYQEATKPSDKFSKDTFLNATTDPDVETSTGTTLPKREKHRKPIEDLPLSEGDTTDTEQIKNALRSDELPSETQDDTKK